MSKIVDDLRVEVELEGYPPGTPGFEVAFRKKKVDRCQQMQGVFRCEQCSYVMHCDLIKAHRRDVAERQQKQQRPNVVEHEEQKAKD